MWTTKVKVDKNKLKFYVLRDVSYVYSQQQALKNVINTKQFLNFYIRFSILLFPYVLSDSQELFNKIQWLILNFFW